MNDLEQKTTERIYKTSVGLLPFLMVLFIITLQLYKDAMNLPQTALPFLVGVTFFGTLQILVSLLVIISFLRLSDVRGLLPKAALGVMAAILFFPMVIFAIQVANS